MEFFEIFAKVFVLLFASATASCVAILPASWVGGQTEHPLPVIVTLLLSGTLALSAFIYFVHWLSYNF